MTRKTSKTAESSTEIAAKVIASTKPRRPSAKDRANGRGGPSPAQLEAAADPSTPVPTGGKNLTGRAKQEYDRRVANQRAEGRKTAAAAKAAAPKKTTATAKKTAAKKVAPPAKKTAAKKTTVPTAKKTAAKKTAAKKATASNHPDTPLAQTRHLPHQAKGGVPHPGPVWHAKLKELGLSQAHAADLMGVAPMTLNRFLNGHGIPSCRVAIAYARATDQDVREVWLGVAEYELAMTLERGA